METVQQSPGSNPERTTQRKSLVASLLTVMDPREVVELHGQTYQPAFELSVDISEAISEMYEHDPEQSRRVILGMAEDPVHATNRHEAVHNLANLRYYALDLSFRLWDQLIRDKDPGVRREAKGLVDEYAFSDPGNYDAIQSSDDLGLTDEQALQLRTHYAEAEQGINVHQLGGPSEGQY